MIKPGDKVFLWSNMNIRGVVSEILFVKSNTWFTTGTAGTMMVVKFADDKGQIHQFPATDLMREE